jgi:hypothetical protein
MANLGGAAREGWGVRRQSIRTEMAEQNTTFGDLPVETPNVNPSEWAISGAGGGGATEGVP